MKTRILSIILLTSLNVISKTYYVSVVSVGVGSGSKENPMSSISNAFHAFRGVKQTMWLGGLITFQKGKNFKHTLLQALISMAVYTTAKGSTHYILQN